MLTASALDIASIVNNRMPSIGFCSRSKRIQGFNSACLMIENRSKDSHGIVDMNKALEAAAMLTHMNKKFHKSLLMTAFCINWLPDNFLNDLAFRLAYETRRDLL